MDFVSIASIVVAAIAAFSAVASQRSAARASVLNTQTTSRVDMEREAYERARNFDTETIRRQDEELEELRSRVRVLEDQNEDLRQENHVFRRDVRKFSNDVARLNQELTFLKLRLRTQNPRWEEDLDDDEEHAAQLPDPPTD